MKSEGEIRINSRHNGHVVYCAECTTNGWMKEIRKEYIEKKKTENRLFTPRSPKSLTFFGSVYLHMASTPESMRQRPFSVSIF